MTGPDLAGPALDALTIDRKFALQTAATRLRDEFADTSDPEAIESFCTLLRPVRPSANRTRYSYSLKAFAHQ